VHSIVNSSYDYKKENIPWTRLNVLNVTSPFSRISPSAHKPALLYHGLTHTTLDRLKCPTWKNSMCRIAYS